MEFAIEKYTLSNILAHLGSFLEKKDASQMASHVLMEVTETGVWFAANDGLKGLKLFAPVNVKTTGKATANGAKLTSFVNAVSDSISITKVDETIKIKSSRSRLSLDSFDANLFQTFPTATEKDKLLPISVFDLASKVTYSADPTNPQPFWHGVYIGDDIVAGNGHILTIAKNEEGGSSSIVPLHVIKKINELGLDERHISVGEINIIDQTQTHFLFSRAVNKDFPNYKRVMKDDYLHSEMHSKRDFEDALKLCSLNHHEVKLKFKGSEIEFISLDPLNALKTSIEVKTVENVELNLNIGYMLSFLKNSTEQEFKLDFTDSSTSIRLTADDIVTYVQCVVV